MGEMVLTLDLLAARSEVARALDALREFGVRENLPPQVSFDICLAADEALANIILHGYGEDSTSPIKLDAQVIGETLILEVVDSGPPFDPLKAPPPKLDVPPEERKPGGLGIFLIRSVSHEVEYRRDGDRNRLTLRWHLERP